LARLEGAARLHTNLNKCSLEAWKAMMTASSTSLSEHREPVDASTGRLAAFTGTFLVKRREKHDMEERGYLETRDPTAFEKVLSGKALMDLEAGWQSGHRRVHPDQIIYDGNERGRSDFVAQIVDGVARMVKVTMDGRRQIVALKFQNDLLGAMSDEHDHVLVEAVSPVELRSMPAERFSALLHRSPDLRLAVLRSSLTELDSARETLLLLGRKKALERVASLLLLVARQLAHASGEVEHINDGMGIRFRLPLSRSEIGNFLGLTTETVSRQMTTLKTQGLIRLEPSKTVAIPDVERLHYAAAME
jgi:CRP/FNR family transcriptional regulator, anaerobic regulatory protein